MNDIHRRRWKTLEPLRERTYRRIWSASVISNFGQLILGVGAAWEMTRLTTSAGMVALVQSALMAPLMLVSVPAGAIADNVGRIIGQALSQRLKQPVVVDNKAGADGAIGTMAVVKAAPDGYSLLVGAPAAILGVH